MASINPFLDTDVLLNWLCKEEDPKSGVKLWEAPYEILKSAENGDLICVTSLINLMEIIFVLRRKKKWDEDEIMHSVEDIQRMPNLEVVTPAEPDINLGFNLQRSHRLDPFDAVYLAIALRRNICVVSRDEDFIKIANRLLKNIAYTPENFLTII
jgi:predicted nucleic acid-binding protein